jgi:hypothetical protein
MSQNNIRIQGHDVMLFDAEGHSFAFGTNASLSITQEMQDVSDKDTGKAGFKMPGAISWSLSSDHTLNWDEFCNFTYIQKWQSVTNMLKVWYGLRDGWEGGPSFDPSSEVNMTSDSYRMIDNSKKAFVGYVFIDTITQNSSNGDAANYTVNFTGVGDLSYTTFSA